MALQGTIRTFNKETGQVSIETPQGVLEASLEATHDYSSSSFDDPRVIGKEKIRMWIRGEKVTHFERAPRNYGVMT